MDETAGGKREVEPNVSTVRGERVMTSATSGACDPSAVRLGGRHRAEQPVPLTSFAGAGQASQPIT
jgi:hypothetical protein